MSIKTLEKFSPGDYFYDVKDQLRRFIYAESESAFALGDAARDAVQSAAELAARTAAMRESLIKLLGGLPSLDTPLNPRVAGIVEEEGLRIEKVIFESRPETYVTANLYIPLGLTKPGGAVLFLCGHHRQAKHQDEYQIVCRHLARAGLVVMAQDPIGQGERFSYYEKTLKDTTVDWGVTEHIHAGCQCLLLGDGIARYFLHDAMRSIDYLLTRPEVDPAKIGVTGNSGGGTQTSLMMLCDTRIAAAAPATFIMDRASYMYTGMAQDCEQIWTGMSALGFDHEDILMAMAPKPVLVLAVTYDFFPIEGARKTVERAKRFWRMFGKAPLLELHEEESEHQYTPAMARAAAAFFSAHLLGQKAEAGESSIRDIVPSLLFCTQTGQVRGEMEGARAIYDENCARLAAFQENCADISDHDRRERAHLWLSEKVFHTRRPCPLNPRQITVQKLEGLIIRQMVWWVQEGVMNHAAIFRDYRFHDQRLPLTIAVWDHGSAALQTHDEWLRGTCRAGRAVMVLNVSGMGSLLPNPFNCRPPLEVLGVLYHLNDLLLWLNDSLAAMRTYDVLRALDAAALLSDVDSSDIQLYAAGKHGIYGRLAAFLDLRIGGIVACDGFQSWSELLCARHYDNYDIAGILLPGVLQHFDLADIDRWNQKRI